MMNEDFKSDRRWFMGTAAMTIAAAQLGMFSSAAESKEESLTSTSAPLTSFGPLKQIEAGLLNTGYAEAGPANGSPFILLHACPYAIYTFFNVPPPFAPTA